MNNTNSARHRMLLGMAAAALLAFPAASADAESLMERAQGDGLRVAFYNFKPYAYLDKSNNLTGEQVDILRHVLGKMDAKIASEQATEWGNLIPGINAKRFDIVAAGMFVTPKRCEQVRFSEPTFGIQQAMVVLKGNPHGIVNYGTIRDKGLKMAVIPGSAQFGYAEKTGVKPENLLQLPDNPTAVAALRAGRIDAWAVSAPGTRELVAGLPEQDMEATKAFDTVAGQKAISHGSYAFRKADSDFVDAFDKHLTAFIGTPEHIAIMEAHGMSRDELPKLKTAGLCAG